MFELLFLLLPIAVAYGWFMGKREALRKYQERSDRATREYVDGLNFLFSNQKDKAVDHFVEFLKDDPNTLEAHLTLGNLFRSRGETDRAIRIHQSLFENKELTIEQRLLAMQQLGQDFTLAGLYDRAEEIFTQLLQEDDYRHYSLQQLLMIYQATSDWIKGIDVATKLIKSGDSQYGNIIAHFYCELSENAIKNNELTQAILYSEKALAMYPNSVRASLLLGRINIKQEKFSKALTYLTNILLQNEMFMSEALPEVKLCYKQLEDGREAFKDFLAQCIDTNSVKEADLYLADLLEQEDGRVIAQQFMVKALTRKPTLKGFSKLIDYYLEYAEAGKAKESLGLIKNMVSLQIKTLPSHRCEKCGFTVKKLYWLCPSCRSWETIKPINEFEIK